PVVYHRGGMIGREVGPAGPRCGPPVHLAERRPREELLQRRVAQQHDDLRIDQLDLPTEVRVALVPFRPRGSPVPGRPALHDVRDEDALSPEPRHREEAQEVLARRSHEGPSLPVLVGAGALAHYYHTGIGRALSRDHPGPGKVKGAFGAADHFLSDGEQTVFYAHVQSNSSFDRGYEPRTFRKTVLVASPL